MGGRSNHHGGLEFAKRSNPSQKFQISGKPTSISLNQRWNRFVLTVHKAEEQNMTRLFARLMIVVNLTVFAIWSTHWGKLKQRFTNFLIEDWVDNFIRAVLSFQICFVLVISIWVFMQQNNRKSKISRPAKILVFAYKVHYFLGYPLILALYSKDIFYLQGTKVLWTWLMIVAGACIIVSIEMSWSSLPTINPLCRPSIIASSSFYTTQCFQLVIQGFIRERKSYALTIALLSFIGFAFIQGAYLYLPNLRLYWNYQSQAMMSAGNSAVAFLRLSIFIVMLFPHGTPLLSMIFVVSIVVAAACKATFSWERSKLLGSLASLQGKPSFVENYTVWQRQLALSDVLTSNIASISSLDPLSLEILRASFKLNQHTHQRGQRLLMTGAATEGDIGLRETTQYQSPRMFSTRMTDVRCDTEVHSEQQHIDPRDMAGGAGFLWLYYSIIVSKKPTKVEDLRTVLVFEMVFLNRCLLSVAGNLAAFRRLLGRYAPRSSELYILESLFQSRLEMQSETQFRDRDGKITLSEILIYLAHEKEDENNLSIRAPLDAKDQYTWMLSDINQLLKAKSHIFTKLLSTSSQKSSYFYRKNYQAQTAFKNIESRLETLISSPSTPSFVFSAAVSYYLKVRFDIVKAERIFKGYQNKLNKMDLQAANHKTREISADNSLCDSVTLRITVSNDKHFGSITDISAGYQELFGQPGGGNPIGLNVNSLFPGELAATHAVMMRNLRNETIFNNQRDFLLNGFDKSLRDVRFLLKLDNSIQNGLTALALLKVINSETETFCLLVNEKGSIIAAQEKVWRDLGVYSQRDSLENKHIEELSFTAKVQLDLYALLFKVEIPEEFDEDTYSPHHTSVGENRQNDTHAQLQSSAGWTLSKPAKESKEKVVEDSSRLRAQSVDRLREKVKKMFDILTKAGVSHQLQNSSIEKNGFMMWAEHMMFGGQLYFRIKVKRTMIQDTRMDQSISEDGDGRIGDGRPNSDFEHMLRGSEFSDETVTFEQFLEILSQQSPIKDYLQDLPRDRLDAHLKESIERLCEYFLGNKYSAIDPTKNVTKTYPQYISAPTSKLSSRKKTEAPTFAQLAQLSLQTPSPPQLAKPLAQSSSNGGEDQMPAGDHRPDMSPQLFTNPTINERPPTENNVLQTHNFLKDSSTSNFKKMELSHINSANHGREGYTFRSSSGNPRKSKNNSGHQKLPVSYSQAYQTLLSPVSMQGVSSSKLGHVESDSSGQKNRHEVDIKIMMEQNDPKLEVSQHSDNRTSVFSALVKKMFRTHAVEDSATSQKNLTGMSAAKILELAQKHAFLAQTQRAVTFLLQHLTSFKTARRQETGAGDNDKNASVSTSTASSRGAHMLKVVNSTLATQKKGSIVYFFSLVLGLFAIGLFAAIQIVFFSLSEYNESNLDNYGIVAQYIFLDRKLIQGAEIGNYLYEHSMAVFNKDDYLSIKQNFSEFLPTTLNSSSYLFARILEAKTDLTDAIKAISKQTAFSISKKDLDEVSSQTFRADKIVYLDRFANDLSSASIVTWNVTFFTSILYVIDLLDFNLKTMQQLHKLGWDTNFNFKLNMSMQNRVQKLNASKLGYDIAVFDEMLAKMTPRFNHLIETLLTDSVDRHFSELFIIMYLSIAWMSCMVVLNIWLAWRINTIQQEYLHNYTLLKPWEVLLLAEDLDKLTDLFTNQALNEVSHVNQFLDFNLRSRLNVLNERAARLQERLSKDKDKPSVSTRFAHNFWFGSSKFTFAVVMLAAVMLALLVTTIYTFLSINSRRLGAQRLQYESHKAMLECTKNYLSVVLLSIYGYYINIAGTKISENAFSGAIDKFIVFQTEKRRDFAFYYGTEQAAVIDDISFARICDRMLIVPVLKTKTGAFYDVCTKMNDGAANKGITGYFQYQKLFLERVRTIITSKYRDFLEASKTTRPAKSLLHELFAYKYIEMRVGNWLMFNIYYYVMNDVTSKTVAAIKQQLDILVSQTMQIVAAAVLIAMTGVLGYLMRLQQAEISTCYQTFHLIDPFFLMNNRYLQFRFKAAYKGIE